MAESASREANQRMNTGLQEVGCALASATADTADSSGDQLYQ